MKMFATFLLWACSFAALAGLGGSPVALGPSSGSSAAAVGSLSGTNYTDIHTRLDSGTDIHQYVNGSGLVFAVSWSGPFLPNLQELLGTHFQSLVDQAQMQSGKGRSNVGVHRDDLMIYSSGRMGAFEGKAWLPALLPTGFDASVIR